MNSSEGRTNADLCRAVEREFDYRIVNAIKKVGLTDIRTHLWKGVEGRLKREIDTALDQPLDPNKKPAQEPVEAVKTEAEPDHPLTERELLEAFEMLKSNSNYTPSFKWGSN
jgi:Cu2+-containing amine oxidase